MFVALLEFRGGIDFAEAIGSVLQQVVQYA
jgi:hypothetical protein